jgi:group II intron reverse transcriptase/maturase
MDVHRKKTVPVEFKMVVDAYRKVKQGGKAAGIDGRSWAEFDKDAEHQCYIIWTRMASGSYHPEAVRSVEIPKKDGSKRKLGIPTLRDRIAQEVVRKYMEERVDEKFHTNSYGYRPLKSAHDALKQVSKNCLNKDWVIDMDIRKFFDEIDHELMLKAVDHIMGDVPWVRMYVKRWLEMPVQETDGSITSGSGKGTPQGGVISPLLANIYLHYTLDVWLSKNFPSVNFVRYADDMVVHCNSKEEAEHVLESIKARLSEVKLSIKEEKTKIAYCKDYRRKEEHETVKFEFLGFSFQPLSIPSKLRRDSYITGFGGKISAANESKIKQSINEERSLRDTTLEIQNIADVLNSKLRGWFNYYGLFNKYRLNRVAMHVDYRLIRWISDKYKLYYRKSITKLRQIRQTHPRLFYHWEVGLNRIR